MKRILTILMVLFVSFIPLFAEDVAYDMSADEYIALNAERAFITGKTSYIIQARMVSEPTDVYNQLELVSYHVENDGESVILTGTLGEEWVTRLSRVLTTYTKPDSSALTASDFMNNLDQKIDVLTIADPNANFALLVPSDTVVRVETAWGDVLYTNASDAEHGSGDYLVCRNVDGKPDLSDVWVVNGAVFPTTYDMSNAK